MEAQTLQTLESLCETLYNTQDAAQRSQTEQMLRPFGTSTEYIPQCRAILDASSNPFAQHFAAASLLKLLTEHSTLTPQVRALLRPLLSTRTRAHMPLCTAAACPSDVPCNLSHARLCLRRAAAA
jgi:exportin-7